MSTRGLFVSIVPRDDDLVKDLAENRPGSHALVFTDDDTETFAIFGDPKDLDWIVWLVTHRGVAAFRTDSRPEAAYAIAGELGYTMVKFGTNGDDRLAIAGEVLAGLDARGFQVVRREKPNLAPEPKPRVFSASRVVDLDDLEPGVIVQRWTIQEDEDAPTVETKLPCCERRMEVDADADLEVDLVCQYDRLRYTLCLAKEYDGGFLACFTVEGRVTVAKPRPAKRRAR
ncbi:hypothetical protein AB0C10_16155 [Microbispora amethystogenes]|uniref:hypothetical protein n=1 Tax=Microbispora amethystogenes TaxID=1427754 RepID=UPI0033FA0638